MTVDRKAWTGFLLLTVFVLCFAAWSCTPQAPSDINVNVNNTATNNNGGNTASPSPGTGACTPVARVGVEVHGADEKSATITVGGVITLDATGRDASDNPRPDNCNVADGISWGVAGPCTVQSGSSWTPQVKGDAVGTCYITAKVKDVTSNAFVLTVKPTSCSTCQ